MKHFASRATHESSAVWWSASATLAASVDHKASTPQVVEVPLPHTHPPLRLASKRLAVKSQAGWVNLFGVKSNPTFLAAWLVEHFKKRKSTSRTRQIYSDAENEEGSISPLLDEFNPILAECIRPSRVWDDTFRLSSSNKLANCQQLNLKQIDIPVWRRTLANRQLH